MKLRKIAVVTGSRAEYGLLRWIIQGVHDDPGLELQLLVTGMHLMSEHGLSVQEIEKDGFPIAARVDLHLRGDSAENIVNAMGEGMSGFGKVYSQLHPSLVVLLGDRFEIFSAAAAAVPLNIPVAHIHGGESTLGAMDEQFRHAITKMSYLHFTSTDAYRQRVIQMGEAPERVFAFGAPGLDSILRLKLFDRPTLAKELSLPEERQWGIVTYHPETREGQSSPGERADVLLAALAAFPKIFWIMSLPNADQGNRAIREKMEAYAVTHPDCACITVSLGQLRYFSLMQHAALMVGNSSSGIIEAPSFRLPVVNVGIRQEGRIRATNVIDVPDGDQHAIIVAIQQACSPEFRASLQAMDNPFGDGKASERIIATIGTIPLESLVFKKFYDQVKS